MRCRIRCASSILPSDSNLRTCSSSSSLDLAHRALDRRLRGDVLRRREDGDRVVPREHLAGERVEVRDLLDLVAEERDAVRGLGVRGLHLDDVALDAEAAAAEQRVVAGVLDVDQLAEHQVAVLLLADVHEDDALLVLLRRAEAVDARDRRDDDHVAAGEEVRGGGVAQPVDVVVPRGVLLDVEVGLRDVRLGLVVVVVGDEVLDRVRREELAELVAELRGERLVVRDHERRAGRPSRSSTPSSPSCRCRWRRAASGSGRPALSPSTSVVDRLRLVAGRAVEVGGDELGHRGQAYPPRGRRPLARPGESLLGEMDHPAEIRAHDARVGAQRAVARRADELRPRRRERDVGHPPRVAAEIERAAAPTGPTR